MTFFYNLGFFLSPSYILSYSTRRVLALSVISLMKNNAIQQVRLISCGINYCLNTPIIRFSHLSCKLSRHLLLSLSSHNWSSVIIQGFQLRSEGYIQEKHDFLCIPVCGSGKPISINTHLYCLSLFLFCIFRKFALPAQ